MVHIDINYKLIDHVHKTISISPLIADRQFVGLVEIILGSNFEYKTVQPGKTGKHKGQQTNGQTRPGSRCYVVDNKALKWYGLCLDEFLIACIFFSG